MADNLNDNDYSNYFKALEQHISGEKNDIPAKRSYDRNIAPHNTHLKKKRPAKIYKVIKIKPLPVILAAVIVLSTVFGTIKVLNSKKSETSSKSANESKNNVSYIPEKKDNIVFDFPDNAQTMPATNDSAAAIVIDMNAKSVISSRNPHQRMYPASTTKIMTLLTAVDNIKNFDDKFTMTLEITDPLFRQDASVAGFLSGEEISMTDLLYGAILPSGADATMGIAIKVAGSEPAFAELMNQKAEELGLKDSHFVNTTGLFSTEHYTSVYDMSVILAAALDNPLCKKILSTYQYTTAKTPQHPEGILLTSTLFSCMYGTEPETATVLGGKTGFVNESGYCIASYGKNNTTNNEYIIVTFKNSARWPAVFGQIELYKQFAK